ncbi:hypothetical protein SLS60_009406 [Paraconiothyrium brasiliense]|uniref:Manganese/iron superoxide dismutase C-terminal domain-containing protein n=1 Tax=Paraconiothyrium brasiliense TaxID=300254 RepID=A0ABR3QU84_9PLEO
MAEHGIPGLFSKKQFDIAYTQYQGHIVNALNTSTSGKLSVSVTSSSGQERFPANTRRSGSEYQDKDPKSLVVEVARDPIMAYTFNVASMAFNNHFFFRGINTNPNVSSTPSDEMLPLINRSFTSLESLRETFILSADAMFGPGFTWLVQTNEGLKILNTYIAGSPLPGAHYRKQSADLNTENPQSYAGAFGPNSKNKDIKKQKALGGVDVTPLLCVNTWEHVWLHDYGVGGKMNFLQKWWKKIDWAQVEQYVSKEKDQSKSAGQGFRQFYSS